MMNIDDFLKKIDHVWDYIEEDVKRFDTTWEYAKLKRQAYADKGFSKEFTLSPEKIESEYARVYEHLTKLLAAEYNRLIQIDRDDLRKSITQLGYDIDKTTSFYNKCRKENAEIRAVLDAFTKAREALAKNSATKSVLDKKSAYEVKLSLDFQSEQKKSCLNLIRKDVEKFPQDCVVIIEDVGGVYDNHISYEKFMGKGVLPYSGVTPLKIKVNIPTGFSGLLNKGKYEKAAESIKCALWMFNNILKYESAIEKYYNLMTKYNYQELKRKFDQNNLTLQAEKSGNVKSDQEAKSALEKELYRLNNTKTLNELLETGAISPLEQKVVKSFAEKALKETAPQVDIKPEELVDVIAGHAKKPDGLSYGGWKTREVKGKAAACSRRLKEAEEKSNELKRKLEKELASMPELNPVKNYTQWAKEHPLWFQFGIPQRLTAGDIQTLLGMIKQDAATQYALKVFPSGTYYTCTKNGKSCTTKDGKQILLLGHAQCVPTVYNSNKVAMVIKYDKNDSEQSVKLALNRTLINLLLAVPPRRMKLRLIDMAATNHASLFTTRLHPSLYHEQVVMNERELRAVVEEWQDRTRRIMQKCEYVHDYNEQHKTWLEPFETVVVMGYPKSLTPAAEEMIRPFVENGYKSGLFFIFVNDLDAQPAHGQKLLENKEMFTIINTAKPRTDLYPLPYTPIADNQQLLDAALEYLNEEAGKREEKQVAKQDAGSLIGNPYTDMPVADIRVAVGEANGRSVDFRLDTVGHLHAFILGQSGTGKSRFLHNIIGNIMLKYTPAQVELYLMDLKLGGVEFNAYRGEKHVRALLVDNNDRQITLEVLREMAVRMEQRNKQFAEIGVRNLEAYNQKSEKPMPQLVLVVDECQMLFTERPDGIERELRNILALIAKQGRSQGVHMILSTQTLMNSTIPIDELQGAGLTDFYLLNCDQRDSEKLVKESSSITRTLQTGEIFFHHHQHAAPDVQFRAYYVDDAQQERMIQGVHEKCRTLEGVDQYYFSGKKQAVLSAEVVALMQRKSRRALCASLGISLDLNQQPISVALHEEQGENILIFGLNQHGQTIRTASEIFLSTLYTATAAGRETRFVVIDCMSDEEDTPYQKVFDSLEDEGLIEQMFGKGRASFITTLAEDVRNGRADETVVLVLGQERWRELRNDRELGEPNRTEPATSTPPNGMPSFLGGGALGAGMGSRKTYRSELKYLLQNGSEQGVHFIWQVDRPQNLLGEQNLSAQNVKNLFRHWVMQRSASEAGMMLRLRDDIRLDTLSDDPDRLRAIYYNDDADTYRLMTPYRYTTPEENKDLLRAVK